MFYQSPIEYDAPVYRPPSEGRSFLIQVTIGCSNNLCTYCNMYRSKKYRERSLSEIKEDILKAKDYFEKMGNSPEKVFLCDGDALGAPTELLIDTLDILNTSFPGLRRIGVYATAENILKKSDKELKDLYEKNLSIAYLGLESGDDKILKMIVKGNTASEMKEASLKIKRNKIKLSTMVMLGVGGQALKEGHVQNTAKIISATSPNFLSFLTTMAIEGTPYRKMVDRGLIQPLTTKELLQEMHDILELSNVDQSVIFRANHVSNMYPLGGTLPRDKKSILATLQGWIAETPEGLYPPMPQGM